MKRGQGGQRGQILADPPHPLRGSRQANGHIRPKGKTGIGAGQGTVPQTGQAAQGCRSIRRPASDSGRVRQVLVQRDPCPKVLPEEGSRLKNKVGGPDGNPLGQWPGDRERQVRCGLEGQFIPEARKDNERVEQMIPVRALARDVKGEIDLGRGFFADHGAVSASRASTASSPISSFSRMRSASLSSGSKDRARLHWNSASRKRPTIQ